MGLAILEKEVWVNAKGSLSHYERLGYKIPRIKDSQGRDVVTNDTKILVQVEDLKPNSQEIITKVCDICGKTRPQPYGKITQCRSKKSYDGKDRCKTCGQLRGRDVMKDNLEFEKCIWNTHPEVATLLHSPEKGYSISYGSERREDFICQNCGTLIQDKNVGMIIRCGLSCPKCSDGVSYPEKFIYEMFNQLGEEFYYQKIFKWSYVLESGRKKTKKYDFYLPKYNCIVEVHGLQHYSNNGFCSLGGRSLSEEVLNDNVKKELAVSHGKKYVIIDASKSNVEHMKRSILTCELNNIFNLNNIDWDKCNSVACKSLVFEACDIWNEGFQTVKNVSARMSVSIDRQTVRKYLKTGAELGLCDYDPKNIMKEVYKRTGGVNKKCVVRLGIDGKYIDEFESVNQAQKALSITHISCVCLGSRSVAGGHKWMYKEDYEKYIANAPNK